MGYNLTIGEVKVEYCNDSGESYMYLSAHGVELDEMEAALYS